MNDEKKKRAEPNRKAEEREKRSDDLDEELEESFPASDPPASTQPRKSWKN